jgi:acetolactate synthase I/II/III large subunit
MNKAELLISLLEEKKIDQAFCLTGGQSMYLNDALSKSQYIRTTFMHHEQSCVMAADAYSRAENKIGMVMVTSGPGSTNTLTGLAGTFLDSGRVLIVSGQTNTTSLEFQKSKRIRQFGVQGVDLQPSISQFVKKYYLIDRSSNIRELVDEAINYCKEGRSGPVWIDFPLDLQNENHIDLSIPINNPTNRNEKSNINPIFYKLKNRIESLLTHSKRPLIIAGQGVSLSDNRTALLNLVEKYKLPVITSRLGIDIINSDHELFIGRPGTYGDRAGNYVIQRSDLIISIGSRLSTSTIGYDYKNFGKNANKIIIDIDPLELEKEFSNEVVKINSDLGDFLEFFDSLLFEKSFSTSQKWRSFCLFLKNEFKYIPSLKIGVNKINPYDFVFHLSRFTEEGSSILVDTGSIFHIAAQLWNVKSNQRYITNGGLSSMGYWVAGIGMFKSRPDKQVIVLTGDGSFQMNIQELAVVRKYNLPLKIIIINNNGYYLIRKTQINYMEGRLFGESESSGLWFPQLENIAKAYEISYLKIDKYESLFDRIHTLLNHNGPMICEVVTDDNYDLAPRIASVRDSSGKLISIDLDNMYPFISEDLRIRIEDFYESIFS